MFWKKAPRIKAKEIKIREGKKGLYLNIIRGPRAVSRCRLASEGRAGFCGYAFAC